MPDIRILVVDDSRQMRDVFVAGLSRRSGMEVVGEAESGDEALRQTARLKPDLVTLDWRMPGRPGPECVAGIKQRSPGTLVILFSNLSGPAAERDALAAGADGFLEKQTNLDELVAAIHALLPSSTG